ncbi:MAG TPA: DUF488 family protein [Cyclobacteriaceae bacterium]|nr:DUF488 family protein [Cyclobacteriaceae bacterium]
MHSIKLKRIYETPLPEDGYRMLVDRLWPRGLKKENAAIDEWNKNVAPSPALRKWFGHRAERFQEFSKQYKLELKAQAEEIKRINAIARKQTLTLLYAAKDEQVNHAIILCEVLK